MTDSVNSEPVACCVSSLKMLTDGYHNVPPGKVAAVVTCLEMLAPPEPRPAIVPPGLSIRRVAQPSLDEYRALYRLVGEPWLWFSRLRMSDAELAAIIHHPAVDVLFLEQDGQPQGLLELDRRQFPEIELAFFGLAPALIGQGAGRYLMAHATAEAWRHRPTRFWVHTCTLDHPRAVEFYLKSGFRAYQRMVEIADDPRLAGEAPLEALPSHPLIR